MKQKLMIALVVAGFSTATFAKAVSLRSQMDQVSYSVGYDIGKGFSTQQLGVEQAQFEAGFSAGLNGTTPAMTPQQMQTVLMSYQKQMQQQGLQKQQPAAATNLQASQAYLAKIAKQPGVVQLQPGLYYKVLTKGTGPVPAATDTVSVNYEGTLPNGTVFDSSAQHGGPASFQVNQVIPGWSTVLQKMPVGSTWVVYIAPGLAYGVSAPPQIGPNQALTFKIQLLGNTASSGS